MPPTTCRPAYDHRMRDHICEERDPRLFQHLGVPRSTAVSWIRRGPRPVVSADVLNRAANRDLLDFHLRKCNAREIRKEIGPKQVCLLARPSRRLPMPATAGRRRQTGSDLHGEPERRWVGQKRQEFRDLVPY